ncbi:MAG: aminotransferase class IV [Bacteroidota bacterium]
MQKNADRFYNSAEKLNLKVPFDRIALKEQVYELIRINENDNGAIRFVMTGGYTHDSYTPIEPNLIVMHHDLKPSSAHLYTDGAKLMPYAYHRDLPEVKTTNYAMGIRLIPQLKAAGAIEPLYHQDGIIHEAVRSNFYIIDQDDKVITTDEEILYGITRKNVLKAIEGHFTIEKRPMHLEELKTAKEAFLTGSNKGVMPVVAVGDAVFGDGKPGPVVKRINDLFTEYRSSYIQAQQAKMLL